MSRERECMLAIRRIATGGTGGTGGGGGLYPTYLGTVASVDGASAVVERTMDGKTVGDVRLNATIVDEDGVVIVPEVGSYVLMTCIDGDKWFVSQYSSIKKITVNVSDTIEVNGGGENLKAVLSEFIDEVAKIIVIQGTSPNVPALNDIKMRLTKILK